MSLHSIGGSTSAELQTFSRKLLSAVTVQGGGTMLAVLGHAFKCVSARYRGDIIVENGAAPHPNVGAERRNF